MEKYQISESDLEAFFIKGDYAGQQLCGKLAGRQACSAASCGAVDSCSMSQMDADASAWLIACGNQDGMVDLRQVNEAVKAKKAGYDFAKINLQNKPAAFASGRSIASCGMNVVDLFCGAGGSSAGFRLAGFHLAGALDNNEKAAATHALNFPDCKTIVEDIAKLSPREFHKRIGEPEVSIVIGSPPCQTFSSLSQGKIKSLGKDIREDIRNYFYKNYLEYIEFYKPEAFLMENVPGFETKYGGKIFQDFLKYVKENLPEYDVTHDIVEAVNFGVPQTRKRLFVCGYKKKYRFSFPTENREFMEEGRQFVTVAQALGDLPEITDDWRIDAGFYSASERLTKYQQFMRAGNGDIVRNNICRVSNEKAKRMFAYLQPGQRYMELDNESKKEIQLFDSFASSVIQSRCRRLPLDRPSWTVIAHIGMDGYEYIHPTECRTLSVREAARLQSFPDDFVFVGNMREQYVQIGNAVPPVLSYSIASKLREALSRV